MKSIEAVTEENVLIRAGNCAVTILPSLGGKIASILIGNRELLQSPLAAYAPRTQTMSFDTGDASGWDECLPSVAACRVETAAGTAELLRLHLPADLRKAVASPGGSTEAGLEALDREGAREAFAAAVRASLERMRG